MKVPSSPAPSSRRRNVGGADPLVNGTNADAPRHSGGDDNGTNPDGVTHNMIAVGCDRPTNSTAATYAAFPRLSYSQNEEKAHLASMPAPAATDANPGESHNNV